MQVYHPANFENWKEGSWLVGWAREGSVCVATALPPGLALPEATALLHSVFHQDHHDPRNKATIRLSDEEFWGAMVAIVGQISAPVPAVAPPPRPLPSRTKCLLKLSVGPQGQGGRVALAGAPQASPHDDPAVGFELHDSNESRVANFIAFEAPSRYGAVYSSSPKSSEANPAALPSFAYTINQINSIWQIEAAITSYTRNREASLVWLGSGTSAQSALPRLAVAALIALLRLILLIATPLKWIVDIKLPQFGRLKDVSMAAKQVDARLTLLASLVASWAQFSNPQPIAEPQQGATDTIDVVIAPTKLIRPVRNSAKAQEEWAKFYNGLGVVFFDWVLGFVFLYLWLAFIEPSSLIQHQSAASSARGWLPVFSVAGWTVALPLTPQESLTTTLWGYNRIKWMLEWISAGNPGGIKLNLPAATALGNLFLFYIERWAVLIRWGSEYFPTLVLALPLSGILGAAFFFSSIHDVMFFVNMHVYWLYSAMARLYNLQLVAIRSCWFLFRGKKRNVLRNRIDSYEYSVDQFLVGTVIFTVLSFLLPTTLAFYSLFVASIGVAILFRLLFHTINVLLNEAPVFSVLTLVVLRGGRLTQGVFLSPNGFTDSVGFFTLHKKHSGAGRIWSDLVQSLARVFTYYGPGRVVESILYGYPLGRARETSV